MDINGATELLAIVGDPLVQARSPSLVNSALAKLNRNAVLVPMQVTTPNLKSVLDGLRRTENFRGAIVTMPHKETVMQLLDDVAPEARLVGACNLLRRHKDGRLSGTMLDGEGFIAGFRSAGFDVRGKRIFLAGAGGAAAGLAHAMGKYGAASLTIYNRTRARAEILAERVQIAWPTMRVNVGGPSPAGCDVVINGTSLGMAVTDPLPCDPIGFGQGTIAAEVVIQDQLTPFLSEAIKHGCDIHLGFHMLKNQIDLMIGFMLEA